MASKPTMQAVRKLKAEPGFEFVEIPVPEPGPTDLLIKIRATSMCGTDVHIYNWEPPWSTGRFVPPKTLGHEVCGEVVEVGSSVNSLQSSVSGSQFSEFQIGDSVSAESHIACGACDQCQNGNGHICRNLKFFSIDTDGFWADYAILPAVSAWKNPKTMRPEIATLQESMGNSVYTVESSHVKGKIVAIFGLGPTGLFSTAIAKAMGAEKVFCIAGSQIHFRIAKQVGADRLIDRHREDPLKALMDATNGKGVDVALEMSGAETALQQALAAVKPTGQVTVLGLPTKPISIAVSKQIVLKDLTLRGIYGRKIWDTWKTTSRLLASGLDIEPIISHRLKLSEFRTGLEAMQTGQSGKVVMTPGR